MSGISVDFSYLNPLSRVFSPLVLDRIAGKGSSEYLSEVLHNSGLIHKIGLSMPFGFFCSFWISCPS